MGCSALRATAVRAVGERTTAQRSPASRDVVRDVVRDTGIRPVTQIEPVLGDTTAQEVDVVVNAADSSLLGGDGVDAYHSVVSA